MEYKKVGDNIPASVCITRQQYNKSEGSHILSNVAPGNYSFRLRAISLAGNGEFTSYKYFSISVSFLLPKLLISYVYIITNYLYFDSY